MIVTNKVKFHGLYWKNLTSTLYGQEFADEKIEDSTMSQGKQIWKVIAPTENDSEVILWSLTTKERIFLALV